MKITHLDVDYFHTGSGVFSEDGLTHTKSLPYLSVVQALEGNYDISLDGGRSVKTCETGVFIAPPRASQHIVHHVKCSTGLMRAHWLFLGVTVNRQFPLDEVFRFPLLVPRQYRADICTGISRIAARSDLPAALSEVFGVLEILLRFASEQPPKDEAVYRLRSYMDEHFRRTVTLEEMTQAAGLSPATLFRRFRKATGTTPAGYLNDIRLQHACILLETTSLKIADIAEAVGIGDPFYFSKLFARKYAVSPREYRCRSG